MPLSSDDLEGKPYVEVVDALAAAGFTSVETHPLGDLITGWLKKPDTVDAVRIGDVTSFDEGDAFGADEHITIDYHSFPVDEQPSDPSAPAESEGPQDVPFWCEGFRFGDAAPIDLRYTQGAIPVTITVQAPAALAEASTSGANATFTVTITNLSKETWDPMLRSLAVAAADKETSVINYGELPTGYKGEDVGAGQSLTFTDEWLVADLASVRYEMRVDGLAGDTVCFTR